MRGSRFRGGPVAIAGRNLARGSRLRYERLETRLMLDAASPVISEFLAVNDRVLADEDRVPNRLWRANPW